MAQIAQDSRLRQTAREKFLHHAAVALDSALARAHIRSVPRWCGAIQESQNGYQGESLKA